MNYRHLLVAAIAAAIPFITCGAGNPDTDAANTLRFDKPAKYFEETVVIGNGNLGATIYGRPHIDKISLNDITLWTGEPMGQPYSPDAHKAIPAIREALDRSDYQAVDSLQRLVQGEYTENYQPLGTLRIEYTDHYNHSVTDYERRLDLHKAVATTSYTIASHRISTEYFASAPDSVIVIRIATTDPAGLNALISFDSQLPHSTIAQGHDISAEGYTAWRSLPNYEDKADHKFDYDPDRGMRFRTIINADTPKCGSVSAFAGRLKISGASEAVIIATNATSFNGFDKNPATEGRDHNALAQNRILAATAKSYDTLLNRHLADYTPLYNRVKLNLGTTDPQVASLPTDVQLLNYTDLSQQNPDLEELYFNFGRYLLISCSRTPGVPANLQGLWNEKMLPPWSCNYTSNINLQENYWPAEIVNLPEMHRPLIRFINNLSKTGATTAKAYYGVNSGWALGHNTDIWALTNPVGLHYGDPTWANWNMGGAWVATHIWEQYLFNKNIDDLRTNYPALRGAAEFCLDWLVEKNGELITAPSTSPENRFITPEGYHGHTLAGGTADLAIIRECLLDTRAAAKTLGIDAPLCKRIDASLKKIHPYRIGRRGNLQEWYEDWPDEDPEHRHQSHLYGAYPGHHISPEATPELAKAVAKSLEIKGDNTTGWSTGWRVNLYARLADADNAYHFYRRLLQYVTPDDYKGPDRRRGGGTYPNLLDAHTPFQIDGNFGGTAGVAEMLVQSTPTTITLLPALPAQWATGSVCGLKARGNVEVSMDWHEGKVTHLSLLSPTGAKTTLKVNGRKIRVNLKPGVSTDIPLD